MSDDEPLLLHRGVGPVAKCRSCKAPIVFAESTTGKLTPFEADPAGHWVIENGKARFVGSESKQLEARREARAALHEPLCALPGSEVLEETVNAIDPRLREIARLQRECDDARAAVATTLAASDAAVCGLAAAGDRLSAEHERWRPVVDAAREFYAGHPDGGARVNDAVAVLLAAEARL